ncbi:MAG: PLP-dependent aminotransferase family protein [Deinococcales bacterium]
MYPLSSRMEFAKPSFVREILKVANRSGMISFAGGLPDPSLFDTEGIKLAMQNALERNSQAALQYGPTDGYRGFMEQVARVMATRGANNVVLEQMLVTTGSQQGIDLIGKIMLDPGDVVLVERPAYLAAVQVFEFYRAQLIGIEQDGNGIQIEELERVLLECKKQNQRPKFLYTVATFGNPSGATLSIERRKALLEIAAREQLLIVEDDPYSELRFAGENVPSIFALSSQIAGASEFVLHMSTLSKFVAPGLRLGWTLAPKGLIQPLFIAKQAADLHSSTFAQHVAAAYLETGRLEAQLPKIRQAYGAKGRAMLEALQAYFPTGVLEYHAPQGGMFIWAKMAEGVDTFGLVQKAIEHNVIFVPGKGFFPDDKRDNYLRLSFATPSIEQIQEGVGRMAKTILD